LHDQPTGSLFLVAVSGGADSTALLVALSALREKCNFRLHCLHVDHGIREADERRGDAEAVKALCEILTIPCTVVVIPAGKVVDTAKERGIGVEAAARFFRHHAWTREMRRTGAQRVLVAHTKDDLLEAALMRFLRGAGPAGLAAMKRENGVILRPLITLTRANVLAYLTARDIPFRTDSSNADIHYLRNRIRHKLMPVLNTLFPGWRKAVYETAETQRLVVDFLEKEAFLRIQWTTNENNSILDTEKAAFFAAPAIIREEALFNAIDQIQTSAFFEPDPVQKSTAPPKRPVLRFFSAGGVPAVDVGPVRIETQGSRILVTAVPRISQAGFVQLIKTVGIYTLERLTFEVGTGDEAGENIFFANLPFVLRSTGGIFIIAEDGTGRIASIRASDGNVVRYRPEGDVLVKIAVG
jgi:tRNA(Ile)-lysidine synthase